MGSIRNVGMTTTLGELPPDLETCHQLIRELLVSLTEQTHLNDKLQHQLEQLLRQRHGRKTRDDRAPLNSCFSLVRSWRPRKPRLPKPRLPKPRLRPTRRQLRLRRAQPRRMGTAASRCRRACHVGPVLHESPPSSFPVPTAAPCGPGSVRRSASSSSMSRPAWSS